MKPARQFDVHPDAEILNGFVESALPDAERKDVLAHLGGCGRCRQIVYLAQDAMPAAEAPANALRAERRIVDGERAWILRWRTGWATAFAFAAIAAFAVFVTIRHREPDRQMAGLAPSPAPAAPAAAPQAAPERPAQSEKAFAELGVPEAEAAAPKAKTKGRPGAGGATSTPFAAAPAPPPAPAVLAEGGPVPLANAATNSLAPSTPDSAGAARVSKPVSSTMKATRFQSAPQAIHGGLVAGNAQGSASGASIAPPATQTLEVNAHSAQLQVQRAAPAQADQLAPLIAAGAAVDKKSGLILLPSGLPLVSTAGAGRTQLAIDAVGALFLSHDFGKNWQPVERQWTGKAVKVRIAQTFKAKNAPLSGPLEKQQAQAQAAVTIPAALFEIVNDRNAIWTSADGKTWTAK